MAIVLTGVQFAAPATALTYYCKLTPQGPRDAIPPDLRIDLDEAISKVTVIDGVIPAHIGKPIDGQLRPVNDNRYLFGWSVPRVKIDSGQYSPRDHQLAQHCPCDGRGADDRATAGLRRQLARHGQLRAAMTPENPRECVNPSR